MKRALILTYNKVPDGDAGAIRQIVFAKMLRDLGYAVFVIGMGLQVSELNEICEYEGIPYCSFRNKGNSCLDKSDNYFGYKRKLARFFEKNDVFDLILVVDLPLNAMRLVKSYAKKNNSVLIHDSVEWYSPEEFKLKKLSSEYLRKDYRNRFFFRKPWRIVAISSYLENHFKNKKLVTCRIPVIMDIASLQFHKKCQSEKVIIVYAGAPGRKDCFDQILVAIDNMENDIRAKFELRIIGVNDDFLLNNLRITEDKWKEFKKTIKCLGRMPRTEVLKNLELADYTILMRKAELRYAKAGFSTKVPESLSTGTPVICNLSSDLGMYLKDGENSIIAENNSSKAIEIAIRRAVTVSPEERKNMQYKAFVSAKENFDYRHYINILADLISREENNV